MKLSLVAEEGKYFRRSGWENETFYIYVEDGVFKRYDEDSVQIVPNGEEFNLALEDILGHDWELMKENPTEIELKDFEGDSLVLRAICHGDQIFNMKVSAGEFITTEKHVDEILTFLYNNTQIGKSRIIPF